MENIHDMPDPENEVQKLQDLVKKLEQQNELLREKQSISNSHEKVRPKDPVNKNDNVYLDVTFSVPNSLKLSGYDRRSFASAAPDDSIASLDDVDILDIDHLSLADDEDSWLYVSPNKVTPSPLRLNLDTGSYDYMLHGVISSGNNSVISKQSLKTKLNNAVSQAEHILAGPMSPVKTEVVSFGSPSVSTHNSLSPSPGRHAPYTSTCPINKRPLTPEYCDSQITRLPKASGDINRGVTHSSQHNENNIQSLTTLPRYVAQQKDTSVNSLTFTRPKKERSGNDGLIPTTADMQNTRSDTAAVCSIEALAKMQEESLRRSFSVKETPPRPYRRSSSGQSSSSQKQQLHDSQPPYVGSQHTNAQTLATDGVNNRWANRVRADAMSSDSEESVYSDCRYGSQELLDSETSGLEADNTRRSLPNLSQGVGTPPRHHSSDPQIEDIGSSSNGSLPVRRGHPSPRTPSHLTSRLTPPSGSHLKRPGFSKTSTPKSGLPIPKTGIPRPSSGRSSLPTPTRRSKLPSPSSKATTPVIRDVSPRPDESWMDGCF